MLPPLYAQVRSELAREIPEERLIVDPLRTLAYGTDASFYRMIPKMVVIVESEAEVRHLLATARRHGTPVTFRAAGTSLSGQAVTDSILALLGDGWRQAEVSPDGGMIHLKPGVIGAAANARLRRFDRKIGPDPASIGTAKIGGIVANNASGMCCGVAGNSYQTVRAMRIILADGALLDTSDAESKDAFRRSHGGLLESLRQLGERTRADGALRDLIARKYRIKNTTGYSLNALIDFTDPIEILEHLMIGSEGTLGFIAGVTLATVPDPRHKASALLLFPDIERACDAVARLTAAPVAAVELMDGAALRSVSGKAGMPPEIAGLEPSAAALLVEISAGDAELLSLRIEEVLVLLRDATLLVPPAFTTDRATGEALWKIRKGLFPAVGATRPLGTTVVIEDVALPIEHLAGVTIALQALFARHGYDEAIIFGHALAGNLHFVFAQDFSTAAEIHRYGSFMGDVCALTLKHGGSLKAEHGTGRNMSPFVELEWGAQAYSLMREIKTLLDPLCLLNPGVILNDDPEAHLKNLKPLPPVDPLVDKCIECGFCEPACPSHLLTLSPRQRIVGSREIARRRLAGEDATELERLFAYQGIDTCAACGLCAGECPVGIDTGQLMKQNRGDRRGTMAKMMGAQLASHLGGVLTMMRGLLRAASIASHVIGHGIVLKIVDGFRAISGGRLPYMPRNLPRAAAFEAGEQGAGESMILYVPSCVSRALGPASGEPDMRPLPEVIRIVAQRAGFTVAYPAGTDGLCCGMPWESKGLIEIADAKADEMIAAIQGAGEGRRGAIVMDTSPCALRLRGRLAATQADLHILDIADFLHDLAMPQLALTRAPGPAMLHVTCSSRRMGLGEKLRAIAEACVDDVVMPEAIGCCGFAGDKGFTNPELNDHALRDLQAAVPAGCGAGYSTSRTCEIGLSDHANVPYRSIAYLVEAASRPIEAEI